MEIRDHIIVERDPSDPTRLIVTLPDSASAVVRAFFGFAGEASAKQQNDEE